MLPRTAFVPTPRALLLIAASAPLAVLLAVLAPGLAASAPILGTLVLALIALDALLAGRLSGLDFAVGEDVDAALADAPWPFLRKPYSGEQLARILGELN